MRSLCTGLCVSVPASTLSLSRVSRARARVTVIYPRAALENARQRCQESPAGRSSEREREIKEVRFSRLHLYAFSRASSPFRVCFSYYFSAVSAATVCGILSYNMPIWTMETAARRYNKTWLAISRLGPRASNRLIRARARTETAPVAFFVG